MPKLSEHTLEKMFPCPYCEEFLRTRQGLSGHIQWKHNVYLQMKQTTENDQLDLDHDYLLKKGIEYEKYGKLIFLSEAQIKTSQNILKQWSEVNLFCKYLEIKTKKTDFKYYLIASLAQMYRNEELEERLINRIKLLLDEYK